MFHHLKFSYQCTNGENYVIRNIARHSVFGPKSFSLLLQFFALLSALRIAYH
jgi:hypothetical protein